MKRKEQPLCRTGLNGPNGSGQLRFAVLVGTVPVAHAACGSFLTHLRTAWQDLVDYSANGCCDGEMVQFVALFLAGTATPVGYPHKTLSAFCCVRGRGVPNGALETTYCGNRQFSRQPFEITFARNCVGKETAGSNNSNNSEGSHEVRIERARTDRGGLLCKLRRYSHFRL